MPYWKLGLPISRCIFGVESGGPGNRRAVIFAKDLAITDAANAKGLVARLSEITRQ
ncbi:hypothetical protein GCM10009069_30250 [Algimonas arctica]|uniref:Uncharacterized protein n=1 Tax=Algimonas arctica TaxID=1479486 RepID=A0A8J3CUW6_9PROT|nr:hypothetical protein GCM10009069_30250 [Algimonas arctica]